MDVNTSDERAHDLACRLDISAQSLDTATWINPVSGTICMLEQTGDYEVWHRERQVLKPVVVGRIAEHEARRLLRNPYAAEARRAAANAIVAVDTREQPVDRPSP
jgi:hypothetical protein